MTTGSISLPPQIRLRAGRAALHVRPRYLHVIEEGTIEPDELSTLHGWVDAWARAVPSRRLLLDARASGSIASSAIHEGWRRWLLSQDWLCQVAYATASESALTILGLCGIADGARTRAFSDLALAHRWLCTPTPTFSGDDTQPTIRLRPAQRDLAALGRRERT